MPEDSIAVPMKERRRSLLTESDLVAISNAFKEHSKCNMGWLQEEVSELRKHGLSPEEAGVLKKFVSIANRAATVIGTVILAAIGTALIALFTKGWWVSLANGIHKSGGN